MSNCVKKCILNSKDGKQFTICIFIRILDFIPLLFPRVLNTLCFFINQANMGMLSSMNNLYSYYKKIKLDFWYILDMKLEIMFSDYYIYIYIPIVILC